MSRLTLTQARKMAGYSIPRIAEMLNVGESTWQNKEHYRSRLYYIEAKRFAEIVGLPMDEIIFDPETER